MQLSSPVLREDGGFIVPVEMAAVLRQKAEVIKLCYSRLTQEQQVTIRGGGVCKLCGTCRFCYGADKLQDEILLDGVWQDCCSAVGIAV